MRIYKFVFIVSLFAVSVASAMDDRERPESIGTHSLSVSQENIDVVVVGGGLSGLKAALELNKSRENYALFEARDRLGGRTYSEVHENHVLNMGGEWIDSDHNNMKVLAKEVGCDLQKETYGKPIRVLTEKGDLSLEDKIALLQSILPQLASAATQEWFDTTTWLYKPLSQILPDTLSPVERKFIAAYLEADTGLSPDALQAPAIVGLKDDLSDFLELFKYKKSWLPAKLLDLKEYQYRVVGGMTRLIEAIRERLDADKIRSEHVLTRIHKDTNNRFHLFFNRSNGAVHEVVANAVIMTIPFSVLRSLDLDESLGLTDLHKQAIQTLSYGTSSKIQVMGDIRPDFRYFINTETRTTAWAPVAGSGLTIFMGGETGATLSQETAAPLMRAVLASSSGREAGPADAPAREEFPFIIKNWRNDPFARGSYSAAGGHSPALDIPSNLEAFDGFRKFADPVGGFILAGEHTQRNEGYMESAVRSGDIAAQHYLANKLTFGRH